MTLRKLCELVFLLLLVVVTANMAGKQTVKGAGAADTVDTFPYATFAEDVPGESERGSFTAAELPEGARRLLEGYARDIETYPAREAARIAELERQEQLAVQPSWVKSVYRVKASGSNGIFATGSGVAVGVGKLHTVDHFRRSVPGVLRWEIEVDGRWHPAVAVSVSGKDLAVLTVTGVELNPVPVRVPRYGERVTVYGMQTKSFAQGVYIGEQSDSGRTAQVALDDGSVTVISGDSGGGIFSDEGELLGTIGGANLPEQRVTWFTPIVADKPAVAALSGGSPPPAPANASVPAGTQFVSAPAAVSCANGVCTQQPSGRWVKTRRGMQWQTF